MNRIQWHKEAGWLNAALSAGGAFVVAKDGAGKANPMTIGWAQVGIVWSMPVMTVLIRESRYTHACVMGSETFSVCVPRPGELREALTLCGTTSGRNVDKVARAGLTLLPAREIDTPILGECGLHYECRVIARTQQSLADFASSADKVLATFYPKGDHHLILLGRIVDAYTT